MDSTQYENQSTKKIKTVLFELTIPSASNTCFSLTLSLLQLAVHKTLTVPKKAHMLTFPFSGEHFSQHDTRETQNQFLAERQATNSERVLEHFKQNSAKMTIAPLSQRSDED